MPRRRRSAVGAVLLAPQGIAHGVAASRAPSAAAPRQGRRLRLVAFALWHGIRYLGTKCCDTMKKRTTVTTLYDNAIRWIAYNDNAGDSGAYIVEAQQGTLTVMLVADTFSVRARDVAAAVVSCRMGLAFYASPWAGLLPGVNYRGKPSDDGEMWPFSDADA